MNNRYNCEHNEDGSDSFLDQAYLTLRDSCSSGSGGDCVNKKLAGKPEASERNRDSD